MKTKKRLVRVDGRADPDDVKVLKRANINISSLIKDAVATAAKQIKGRQ